ncbi:MAG: hypothetical protein IT292_02130 [Deltaproteobacteria bacterium]|nr:hypothetical protein [Deltaproteobacteria bacterium]
MPNGGGICPYPLRAYDGKKGERYFLENAEIFVNQPEEFSLRNNRLVVMPLGGADLSIPGLLAAPKRPQIVKISKLNHILIKNFTLRNNNTYATNYAAPLGQAGYVCVLINDSNPISVEGNIIQNCSGGIIAHGTDMRIVIIR